MLVRRVVRVTAVAAAIALALLLALGSAAATPSGPRILGTYQVVLRYTGGPNKGQGFNATFRLRTFNRATGAFAGTGTSNLGNLLTISGSLKGSAIAMAVVGRDVGTEHIRGSFQSGTAGGTFQGDKGTGKWRMTRSAVVVNKTGWGRSNGKYAFGVQLVNRSNRDALGVTVTVQGKSYEIPELPAGQSFVVADGRGQVGSPPARVASTVYVQHTVPHDKSNRVLRVSQVRLDQKNYAVSAVITNPYAFAINTTKADAYAVLYDSAGRIIGGGNAISLWLGTGKYGPAGLKSGGSEKVTIFVAGNVSRVARVEVSAAR
jgi:hypothetical protein